MRPARKVPTEVVDTAKAIPGFGLEGDRRCQGSEGSARQVTVISVEYINVITRLLKKEGIDPAVLRRNLVVSGINLTALRHQRFQIGECVFEATALCHPCQFCRGTPRILTGRAELQTKDKQKVEKADLF